MKKNFLCVALVVLALSVTGCNEKPVDGEGNVTSESTEESSVSQESTDSDVSTPSTAVCQDTDSLFITSERISLRTNSSQTLSMRHIRKDFTRYVPTLE